MILELLVINVLLLILAIIFVYYPRKLAYWRERNVASVEASFPFGTVGRVTRKITLYEHLQEVYETYKGKEKIAGIYMLTSPVLVATDLDLIKTILIKDFHIFYDRGIYVNEVDDPMTAHLFNISGQMWKFLRTKLSPTFTSGKMKLMYDTIARLGDTFSDQVERSVVTSEPVDIKSLCVRFTCDVISLCAFGLETNSLENKDAEVLRLSNEIFKPNFFFNFRFFFVMQFQEFAKKFHLRVFPKRITDFFMNTLRQTVGHREANNISRNDFLQMLMQLKNQGYLQGAEHDDDTTKLTFDQLAAQAFIFFFAGFETSSTAMTFAFLEMALNQDVQTKARKEILTVLAKYDGVVTYDAIMEMDYLNKLFNETLRKHPPIGILVRKSSKDYKISDTTQVIPKDKSIMIPVYGIHHDANIYPEPEKFDPERFGPEAVQKRHPCAFLPFGEGPKNCIGLRFAYLQSKLGLIKVLKSYKWTLDPKTQQPLKQDPKAVSPNILGDIWLKAVKLDSGDTIVN